MRCESIVERLDAFRTGELEPSDRDAVMAHLAGCPVCAEELADLGRLAARAPLLRVGAPRELLEHVLESTGDRYGVVETDLGPVWVGFSTRGVTMVRLGADGDLFERDYEQRLGRRARRAEVPARYARAVRQASAGARPSKVPIDLSSLPPFEREVLPLLSRIPRGEVRPYAWLANAAGRPKAARATGNALARNPVPLLLPCHRVVPASGGVGSYIFGSDVKHTLLQREGVPTAALDKLARRASR
jgi:O-6-methylguanine DNA methyltransferase